MCICIMILTIEEKATAPLWIKIPQQHTKTGFCQETSQVNGGGGLSHAALDIIYGNLFQKLKLLSKVGVQY